MSILNYIKSMLPSFGSNRIQEDIAVYQNELAVIVLPSYASAAAQNFRGKSQFYKEVDRVYRIGVRNVKKDFVSDIHQRLQKLPEVLTHMQRLAEEEFQAKVVSEAMTARKATVLRVIESVGFINKYSLSLVSAVAVRELEEEGSAAASADATKGEIVRLQKYLPDFVRILKVITDAKDLEGVIRKMPELSIDESVYNTNFAVDVDPLGLFQVTSFRGSPAYWMAMVAAEWQNNRLRHMQEQKKALDLRLMMLRRRQEKQNDPKLEVEIELTARQSANFAEKIRHYEESLA